MSSVLYKLTAKKPRKFPSGAGFYTDFFFLEVRLRTLGLAMTVS